jgi:hypothetical protein
MWEKQVSPKIQKAAEEYLTSLNSSRQYLTDKQWELLVNYIKTERQFRYVAPFILAMGVILICLAIFYFRTTNECITSAVPKNVVYVTNEPSQNSITLTPEHIKSYLEYLREGSSNFAINVLCAVYLFLVIITGLVTRKQKRKYIEALVERRDMPNSSSIG